MSKKNLINICVFDLKAEKA